jgi:hypothetical protein
MLPNDMARRQTSPVALLEIKQSEKSIVAEKLWLENEKREFKINYSELFNCANKRYDLWLKSKDALYLG